MENLIIRHILPSDNTALAVIIRNALAEFGANKPGTVYYDETTDHLSELFRKERCSYFVAEINGTIAGGAGIFPSEGLPDQTCELVKMYLDPSFRGMGLGKLLIERCLEFAKANNYRQVYIETMPELKKAIGIYEKFGFSHLAGSIGNTGHYGCEVWMLKNI